MPISDNGQGLTAHEDGGHGLHNMQSRAQAAGGHLDYRSGPDGLTITLHVPPALTHIPEAA